MTVRMKLSVVIPAYNCAGVIPATLDALLAQTLTDWEALVVNDGSTDNTQAVLEGYAARDPRIRVISTENAGPAHARNTGIEAAQGEYLCFLDSDDLPLPEMYGMLVSSMEQKNLDVVACGYWMEDMPGGNGEAVRTEFAHPPLDAETPEQFRAVLSSLIRAHLMYVVWNKCWRVDFLREHSLRFENYHNGEDRLFNFSAFPHIRRFGCLGKPLYRYLIRGGDSLVNRWIPDRFEASLACHESLLCAYRALGLLDAAGQDTPEFPGERAGIDFQLVKLAMSCFTQLSAKGCPLPRKEKRQYIRGILSAPQLQAASRNPVGGYAKIVDAVLRSENITLIGWMSKAIWLLQGKLHPLYLRLKKR